MKKLVINQKERVGQWVAAQMGKTANWSAYEAIGIEQNGELVGGVVIDGYSRGVRCSIHCSGIGKKWINREFIHFVFTYVFLQLDCKCAVNPVDMDNEASRRFTKHIGFTQVAEIPEANLVIYAMPRAQCRWLKKEPSHEI
jgi:RimJ/RimL family protein N-acetyltransferase